MIASGSSYVKKLQEKRRGDMDIQESGRFMFDYAVPYPQPNLNHQWPLYPVST